MCPDNRRRRDWRHPGQRADPAFTIACHTDPHPGVMVWGDNCFDSQTSLVVIRGTLTAQRYVDDYLRIVHYISFCSHLTLFFSKSLIQRPEGRIRAGYLLLRTQVLYRPLQNDHLRMMFGTSLYRYHTTTYSHTSVLPNRRANDTIFLESV
ncbi:transposable element Tc1 transposase [Trichonephila clavipes]|nr:transposable element Tc1 transposase [Trichonephila clavipes]